MTTHQKLTGVALISLSALCLTVTFAAHNVNNLSNVIALNRTVSSADYTTEFYGRAFVNGEEKYLTYTNKKLETTTSNNVPSDDSKYIINFTSSSTATLKNGENFLGWSGSGTDITISEYEWNVHDGALYTSDETRVLMYQAGAQNTGKIYAISNIGKENYYPIIFYTLDDYNAASMHCNWNQDRNNALQNLAYDVPETCTISFNANGGSGTMASVKVIANEEFILPTVCDFTAPSEKEFDGWALSANGSKLVENPIITEDIILYALWRNASTSGTINFILSSANTISQGGVTVSFAKASGSTAPAWYSAGLRLYASNTITITSSSNITSISFNWEKQGSKAFASASADTGNYTHPSAAGVGTWTGSAKTIIFTLGSSGQLQLNEFSVTY